MKKLLSTVLALAMLISMLIASSVAFAEEVNVTTSQLSPTSVNVGENASFRVITTTATKFIALFDEEDNMLRSWDAASYAEKSKDKLAWHVMCPMEKAGNISVRFFASADGVDYIPRKNSTTVEVIDAAREITCTDVPAVNKVSQNEYNDVYPYDKLSFSVYTSDNAKFLALFDEAGTKLGSWTAAEFAAYTGNGEMKWTALTRPAMLGMSKCIFKASEDGETYGKEAFSFLNVKTADLSAHTEYLGDWYCVSMIEGGETLNPAEYGMEITLTLNADCTASVDMMGEIETAVWNVNEDGISLMTMNGALQADGTLVLAEDGSEMVFGREKPEAPVDLSAYPEYLGVWYCVEMIEGGESLNPAEYDMEIVLTLNADGSAVIDMMGEADTAVWKVTDDCIDLMGMKGTLQADGTLVIAEDGSEMVFGREKPEAPVDLSAYPEYLGDWYCVEMVEGGESLNPAEYDMEIILTLNADGSAVIDMMGEADTAVWKVTDDCIDLMGMKGTLQADGTLIIAEDGSEMVFGREKAAAEPATDPITVPENTDVYTIGDYYSDYMGIWYGISMTEGGQTYDMAALGMDMTLQIYPDCRVSLTMAGETDEAAWEGGDNCIIIDGAPLTLEDGMLKMQQYGTEMVFSRTKPEGGTADLSAYTEYLGDWYCVEMTEGGETINPAEYGMAVILTLNADGSAVIDMMGETETAVWNVTEGGMSLLTMSGTLREDGTLVIAEDGTEMVFSREAVEITVAGPDMTAYADYIGTWVSDEYGMTVTIKEDATAAVETAGITLDAPLTEKYGYLYYQDTMLRMQYDGKLLFSAPDKDVFLSRKSEEIEIPEVEPFDMTPYADFIGMWGDGSMTLTISEDGSAEIIMNGETRTSKIGEMYGLVTIDDLFLIMQGDGTLSVSGGAYTVLKKDWQPEPEAFDMTPYADFIGMWGDGSITLTISEDGSAEIIMNGETRTSKIGEMYGLVTVDDLFLIMQGDGTLSVSGGAYTILHKDWQPEPEPDLNAYIGTWYAAMVLDGENIFFADEFDEIFGIKSDMLTISEDGTAALELYGALEAYELTARSGKLWIGSDSLDFDINDRLVMSKNDAYPAVVFERERDEYFVTLEAEKRINERMDVRYVCTGADMGGFEIDASMLGGEYTMTFHIDGTMELIMAGMELQGGLTWEITTITDEKGTEQTAFTIDYFGTKLEAVLTEVGFDMNYLDSMLMHFEPELN